MIRHIMLARFSRPVGAEEVAAIRTALEELSCPGRRSFAMGTDLGLRVGNLDLAMVADFDDEQAFADYDRDPEHDRIRREMIAPLVERFERCQFRL